MGRRSTTSKFPVARIKKIMQSNEDVGKVASATPVAISKALELFMSALVDETAKEAKERGSKKVTAYHLKRAILAHETFDFCKDIVASVPDPVEGEGEEEKRAGKRRKVDKTEKKEEA